MPERAMENDKPPDKQPGHLFSAVVKRGGEKVHGRFFLSFLKTPSRAKRDQQDLIAPETL